MIGGAFLLACAAGRAEEYAGQQRVHVRPRVLREVAIPVVWADSVQERRDEGAVNDVVPLGGGVQPVAEAYGKSQIGRLQDDATLWHECTFNMREYIGILKECRVNGGKTVDDLRRGDTFPLSGFRVAAVIQCPRRLGPELGN